MKKVLENYLQPLFSKRTNIEWMQEPIELGSEFMLNHEMIAHLFGKSEYSITAARNPPPGQWTRAEEHEVTLF